MSAIMRPRARMRSLAMLPLAALALSACEHSAPPQKNSAASAVAAKPGKPAAVAFTPPPLRAIPDDAFGAEVRKGEALFRNTAAHAPQYVGNTLTCQNCHLDAGRLADSAPMWAAWVSYPAYRSKNQRVNTFQERLQGCFRFSMNGKAPPLGAPELVALEAYSYWMAQGAPTGTRLIGAGYPKLARPAQGWDYARGESVYREHCALCHAADGQGLMVDGKAWFPPLWGPQSYNWGAGMSRLDLAAGFIKANMPLGNGNNLSDQQAWDVAYYIDSHERPQDPRYQGSIEATRAAFHDGPYETYGRTVQGHRLGAGVGVTGGSTVEHMMQARGAAAAPLRD
ncbi:c-type cytochrome [Metallibacterium sp.]|uniref:c-type cytochrome n=1 Tax=Metallibacterium sp. TaxID=2940281 RepID=UPI00262197C5|nr:c-type cytochrome [Metallibacterium sp.]